MTKSTQQFFGSFCSFQCVMIGGFQTFIIKISVSGPSIHNEIDCLSKLPLNLTILDETLMYLLWVDL